MKIGVLGTAEIAFRRFLPALQKCEGIEYAGVASRTSEKGRKFKVTFGGEIYPSYDALLEDQSIDAVYVPLPPALHYEWGRKVLEHGKHLLMEKPFTTSLTETKELLHLAEEKRLAVHENYMFLYHSQLAWIKEQIHSGVLGEVRLIRTAFGFPFRGTNDFRYNKDLGGGALLDCGGYPLRLVVELLGPETSLTTARLNMGRELEVDLYGSATLENSAGQVAQLSFGMDNSYKCELEVWGSKGCLLAPRIFTAPAGFAPTIELKLGNESKTETLPVDDSFEISIRTFLALLQNPQPRHDILLQARLVDDLRRESHEKE